MKSNKLISLLSKFSAEQHRAFVDFVRSPYFNKRQDVVLLYNHLRGLAPTFKAAAIEHEKLYKVVYGEAPYNDKQLKYVMNFLLKIAEHFLAIQAFEQDTLPRYEKQMEVFIQNDLDKHYAHSKRKVTQFVENNPIEDSNTYYWQYRIAILHDDYTMKVDSRKYSVYLQEAADALDQFYFSQKLQLIAEMKNRARVMMQTYDIRFEEPLMQLVAEHHETLSPLVGIYYRIIQLIEENDIQVQLDALISLLNEHFDRLSPQEQEQVIGYSINHCSRKIRQGDRPKYHGSQALWLYRIALSQRIFYKGDYLPAVHFRNIIKLALNLKQYKWAESFIQDYNDQLREEERADAMNYNLAEFYYHQQQYAKAMIHLQQALNAKEFVYKVNARILLLKVYFELAEEEPLLSLLASFKLLLRRNNNASKTIIDTRLNFCRLLTRIMRRPADEDQRLKVAIETTKPLTDRKWLLQAYKKMVTG
ncbi:MAG: hypothetical protein AAGI23_22385 [Bacteroidota bacterium]